ncbi:MAG: hypothetical protein AAFN74_26225 [Myxococcota bacterium]
MADDLRATLRRGLDPHRNARRLTSPWPSLNALIGDGLWPGLYGLTGASGTGRTQLLLQWLLHAASSDIPAVGYLAFADAMEITARLVGLLEAQWWSTWSPEDLRARAPALLNPPQANAPLDVIGLVVPTEDELRARLQKARSAATQGPVLVGIDAEDTAKIDWSSVARIALSAEATVIAVGLSSPPAHVRSIWSGHFDLAPAAGPRGPSMLRFLKNRHGDRGEVELIYEQGRFEAPPAELELELKDIE